MDLRADKHPYLCDRFYIHTLIMASIFRRSILLFIPLFGFLASCSEDFEVGAPYKPVTVVYGMLNMSDTAHYIRIQKAFLDENKSALDLAKIADSSFYSSLVVHLKEFRNGVLTNDELLQRVDLNTQGFVKQPGVFFNSPNYAYKSKMNLSADDLNTGTNYRYRLVITNTATAEVDSAETPVISSSFQVDEFYNSYRVSFPAISQNAKYSLTARVPENAEIFEGILRFRWVNVDGSGLEVQDSVDWQFASAARIPGKGGVLLEVPERSFYGFLQNAIAPAPLGITRKISKVDIIVWAGSKELQTYELINGAQGGITADQIKPLYTNMKGANVYGLFTTRTMRMYRAPVSDITVDSLMTNATVKALNFSGRSFY
jgi:hypothetical protein